MTMPAAVEPCPPDVRLRADLGVQPIPQYGGHLFFNEDMIAGCPNCGWRGVPTVTGARTIRSSMHGPRYVFPEAAKAGGIISTRCPSCESPALDKVLRAELAGRRVSNKVPRNELCPCGSGLKAKKCRCREYTT